jgi:hypothetical protein
MKKLRNNGDRGRQWWLCYWKKSCPKKATARLANSPLNSNASNHQPAWVTRSLHPTHFRERSAQANPQRKNPRRSGQKQSAFGKTDVEAHSIFNARSEGIFFAKMLFARSEPVCRWYTGHEAVHHVGSVSHRKCRVVRKM